MLKYSSSAFSVAVYLQIELQFNPSHCIDEDFTVSDIFYTPIEYT